MFNPLICPLPLPTLPENIYIFLSWIGFGFWPLNNNNQPCFAWFPITPSRRTQQQSSTANKSQARHERMSPSQLSALHTANKLKSKERLVNQVKHEKRYFFFKNISS
jgi:hypothetical protein